MRKSKKAEFYLSIIFAIYIVGIILKKIFYFQDGYLDIIILITFMFFLLLKPKKLMRAIKSLFNKSIFIYFLLFTIYFIILSFNSYNSIFLIILEYLSVLKWLIYFFIGYLFAYVYNTKNSIFPKKNEFSFFVLIVLIYSILFYNWSGLEGPSTLFGFYTNSYESLFSLRSVFAIFGLITFIYALNISSDKKIRIFLFISSFIFLFMSGNRKTLVAFSLIILFMKSFGKYKLVFKILKIFIVLLFSISIINSSLFSNTTKEYSNTKQPRIFAYIKSFEIATDYFPFGSGPATMFSKGSMLNYSPLYREYNIDEKWGFRKDDKVHFYNDTYWAQIIAQYGLIGFLLILLLLIKIFKIFIKHKQKVSFSLLIFILFILSFTTPLLQRIEVALLLFFVFGMKYKELVYYKQEGLQDDK